MAVQIKQFLKKREGHNIAAMSVLSWIPGKSLCKIVKSIYISLCLNSAEMSLHLGYAIGKSESKNITSINLAIHMTIYLRSNSPQLSNLLQVLICHKSVIVVSVACIGTPH